jgi:pimeloyl-ACP methyl ester carboxylesterase
MPVFKLGEWQLHYEVHGKGEPLLLIAGLSLDSSYWQPYLAELSQQHRVIVLDNRGVGKTKGPDKPYTIFDMADDVAQLLDYLAIPQCHVLGFSMGGFIAQSLALRYLTKVRSLILVATACRASARTQHVIQTWVDLSRKVPRELLFREQAAWVFSESFLGHEELCAKALEEYLSFPIKQSPEQFQRQADACRNWDLSKQDGQIIAPTLILFGSDDRLFTLEETHFLAKLIPNVQLEIVADAAHELLYEEPEACGRLVAEFCARHAMANVLSIADSASG